MKVACTSFVLVLVAHDFVIVAVLVSISVSVQTLLGYKKDEQNSLPVEKLSRTE